MNLILSWLILSIAIFVTAEILPGFHVKSAKSAALVAVIFGVLNFFLGWLIFAALTVVTLGLAWVFAFVTRVIVNAILLKLTDRLTDHLTIDSFGWAVGGAIVMSALGTLGQWLLMGM